MKPFAAFVPTRVITRVLTRGLILVPACPLSKVLALGADLSVDASDNLIR
jgi:hypothetical protein